MSVSNDDTVWVVTSPNVRTDLYDLYRHFLSFSASQLVGVATDQTPHYHDKTRWYRHQVPDTRVGSPGRYQVRVEFSIITYYDEY